MQKTLVLVVGAMVFVSAGAILMFMVSDSMSDVSEEKENIGKSKCSFQSEQVCSGSADFSDVSSECRSQIDPECISEEQQNEVILGSVRGDILGGEG